MFDVCLGGLATSLEKPPLELAFRSALALTSVMGWGLLWNLRRPVVDLAYAYLQGLVLLSVLLLVGSLTLGPSSFLGFGALGLLLSVTLFPGILKQAREKRPRDLRLGSGLVLVAAVPFLLQLLRPFPFSDSTSIWGFHAKALSCEPLFQAHYIRENIWAGTHSEYPLFFPLIEAFFFRMTNSFRDDWSKLWEVFAALALLSVVIRETYAHSRSAVLATLTTGAVLTLMSNEGWDGRVEFSVFLFTALCAVAFLRRDWRRLPLFIFGLAFTKNEGLVSAGLACVLFAPFMLRDREGRRSLAISAALIILWIPVLSRLPSHQEQYPSNLINAMSWKAGLANAGPILLGMLDHLKHWQWLNVFVLAPLVVLWGGILRRRKGIEGWILFIWPVIMIGIFFLIYLVSPWGPSLHANTFDRLLFPLSAALILALFYALEKMPSRDVLRTSGFLILAFLCVRVKITTEWMDALRFRNYPSNSDWQIALRLDRELPFGAAGAVLNDPMYYGVNYMLYPRRFYAAEPQTVAGTIGSWKEWRDLSEVPKDSGYQFIVDARQRYSVVQREKTGRSNP